ncbi:hypothetical protein [Saprospira grandis]|uniref:hypothetical protein n=1 Tax=Saprospira grandis TaxID=1008 RepID=UPI0022DE744C|nr:hypothetical protein [Saprospira grandis]WBM74274.1 hypothetical protein OP864_14905 [Saprospira grandis]
MRYLAIILCLALFSCGPDFDQSEESLIGGWMQSRLGTDSYLILEKDHSFKRYSKNEIPGGGKYFTLVEGSWKLEGEELLFELGKPKLYVNHNQEMTKELFNRMGSMQHSEIFDRMKIGYVYTGKKLDRLYFEEGQWTTVWVPLNPRELQLLVDFVAQEEN